MTDAQLLLFAWIPTMMLGIGVSTMFMLHATEDKAFLRALQLNGPRELLVSVNFSEALSKFVFKLVYGLLGLWALTLRVQTPVPLTLTGYVAFGSLFFPILWITLTDLRNYRRKLKLVDAFVRDNVEFVKVQMPTYSDKLGGETHPKDISNG